jgi:predicted component of type VI protein secretion system
MDMPTLTALLGPSKLNMVTRFADLQEQHPIDAVKRLETFNARKEIAEAEKRQAQQRELRFEEVPTISPAGSELSAECPNKIPRLN